MSPVKDQIGSSYLFETSEPVSQSNSTSAHESLQPQLDSRTLQRPKNAIETSTADGHRRGRKRSEDQMAKPGSSQPAS